ncbi:hypothetical protein [Sellimonas intestinalis]|uniref:hypothetical protein n=1 Tax=Sellimonas intestinalis TaxID=1653434 RepID=UPI0039A22922
MMIEITPIMALNHCEWRRHIPAPAGFRSLIPRQMATSMNDVVVGRHTAQVLPSFLSLKMSLKMSSMRQHKILPDVTVEASC